MELFLDLAPFVVLALASSLHCLGMCGGLVAAVACDGSTNSKAAGRVRMGSRAIWFSLGKALTYGGLGLAVGLAPQAWTAGSQSWRSGLAWVAGLMLIALGVGRLTRGRLNWFAGAGGTNRAVRAKLTAWSLPLRSAYGQVAALPGYAGALGAGLMAGLLPCGVTWTALALALTQGPLAACLGMFVFGLATSPSLMVATFGAGWLRGRPQAWHLLAGPLLIALGLWTGLRGGVQWEPADELRPECCRENSLLPE